MVRTAPNEPPWILVYCDADRRWRSPKSHHAHITWNTQRVVGPHIEVPVVAHLATKLRFPSRTRGGHRRLALRTRSRGTYVQPRRAGLHGRPGEHPCRTWLWRRDRSTAARVPVPRRPRPLLRIHVGTDRHERPIRF